MKKGLIRAVVILMMVMMPLFTAGAEEVFPPTPEPPDARGTARPTPIPTAPPPAGIIDHVHLPDEYTDFAFPEDSRLLEIWFPNIRDADMAVLLYEGQVWMIDCGDERAATRGVVMLKQLGITKIDTLFNSHLHHDHIDGLGLVDDTAKVGEIRICFAPALTQSGLRMIQTAEARGIPVKEYWDGDRFTMGDGAVELLFLKNDDLELDINNQSAVTKVTYGKRSILFTADMERPGQEAMIRRLGDDTSVLKCDIVKYPHHAKSDLSTAFYEAMGAKLAIVTSLEGRRDAGQYAMANRGLPGIFTASLKEFVHLVTDGGDYWLVEKVPITFK